MYNISYVTVFVEMKGEDGLKYEKYSFTSIHYDVKNTSTCCVEFSAVTYMKLPFF